MHYTYYIHACFLLMPVEATTLASIVGHSSLWTFVAQVQQKSIAINMTEYR